MGEVIRIGKNNPASRLLVDAAHVAGDLAFSLGAFEKALPADEVALEMHACELRSMMTVMRKTAEQVCEILGDYLE